MPPENPVPAPQSLSSREAANRLGLRENTLAKWRWQGKGPRYRKLGKAVRYNVADLDAFDKFCTIETTNA